MDRGKRLTNRNINVLLEQIDNGNISEFEESEDEENFVKVNDILEQNLKNNEDIDLLLLENDEYFKQFENSNFNFIVSNSITSNMSINTNDNKDQSIVSYTDVVNLNYNLATNVQQIKYINNMKWLRTNNFKQKKKLIRSSPNDYNDSERQNWTPINYFNQYINDKTIENMVNCTNIRSVVETGKSIQVSIAEMKSFIGCNIFMSSLGYPRMRMFWAKTTRVALIGNAMARNRFFLNSRFFKSCR